MRLVLLPTVSVGTATAALLIPATYQALPELKYYSILPAADIHVATTLADCTTNSPWKFASGERVNIPTQGGPLYAIAASATNTVSVGAGAGAI